VTVGANLGGHLAHQLFVRALDHEIGLVGASMVIPLGMSYTIGCE
jgi:hypothetical protein